MSHGMIDKRQIILDQIRPFLKGLGQDGVEQLCLRSSKRKRKSWSTNHLFRFLVGEDTTGLSHLEEHILQILSHLHLTICFCGARLSYHQTSWPVDFVCLSPQHEVFFIVLDHEERLTGVFQEEGLAQIIAAILSEIISFRSIPATVLILSVSKGGCTVSSKRLLSLGQKLLHDFSRTTSRRYLHAKGSKHSTNLTNTS